MANQFAAGKRAIAACDRCGFRVKLLDLRELTIRTKKTNLMVCRACWEPDHPQLMQGMYPVNDPQALRNPRPDRAYETSGTNIAGGVGEGSRVTEWGWAPVGGGNSLTGSPNSLVAATFVGTVSVVTA